MIRGLIPGLLTHGLLGLSLVADPCMDLNVADPCACGAALLSDRGCSCSCGVTLPAAQHCGTTKFASDNVLQAPSVGGPVSMKPEDDLESLVPQGCVLQSQLRSAANKVGSCLATPGAVACTHVATLWDLESLVGACIHLESLSPCG